MRGMRLSLLFFLPLVLASCSVEVYGGNEFSEDTFVDVLASSSYLPSGAVQNVRNGGASMSSGQIATYASLFPFKGLSSGGNHTISFYEGMDFSYPIGTQTISGHYDEGNGSYYLLIGNNRGFVYDDAEVLDSYRGQAIAAYESDYDTCYDNYLILEGMILGTDESFDRSLYKEVSFDYANVTSTAGYSAHLGRYDENGNYCYLEFNVTMDYIDEMSSYAITDLSYRLKISDAATGIDTHYIMEYKFDSSAEMAPFSWTRRNYNLVYAGLDLSGVGMDDYNEVVEG